LVHPDGEANILDKMSPTASPNSAGPPQDSLQNPADEALPLQKNDNDTPPFPGPERSHMLEDNSFQLPSAGNASINLNLQVTLHKYN